MSCPYLELTEGIELIIEELLNVALNVHHHLVLTALTGQLTLLVGLCGHSKALSLSRHNPLLKDRPATWTDIDHHAIPLSRFSRQRNRFYQSRGSTHLHAEQGGLRRQRGEVQHSRLVDPTHSRTAPGLTASAGLAESLLV